MMSGRVQIAVLVNLLCFFHAINSAVTGYFYENPIKAFNPPEFLPLRSTGQYVGSTFGQKVVTTPRPGYSFPPIPTFSSLTTTTPTHSNAYQHSNIGTQNKNFFTINNQQQQQTQFQRGQQQQKQIPSTQVPFRFQTSQTTTRQPTLRPAAVTSNNYIPPSREVQNHSFSPNTPAPVVSLAPSNNVVVDSIGIRSGQTDSNSNSNSPQILTSGLLDSSDIYVVDGRQLKQYKVYEHIDNDIEQEVQIMPENFFLNSFPSIEGSSSALSDGFQIQNRASGFQQTNQQLQRSNAVALGSGGLGFVRLPNGGVYLGSGSLGYINGLQHAEDVQKFRGLSGLPAPDALHFGPVHQ